MKTTKHKLILFLILTLPILFLTSCLELSDADWELLEVAFESWAEENGLLENDQWKPDSVVEKAIENTVGNMTNKEPFIQLGALDDVIRDIDRADELASEAMMQDDLQKMQTAIELRPKDWRLREQNSVLWESVWASNPEEDDESFHAEYPGVENGTFEADDIILEQIKQSGDCVKHRRQQLEYREILLSDALNNCSKKPGCDESILSWNLASTQEILVKIYDGEPLIWCELAK